MMPIRPRPYLALLAAIAAAACSAARTPPASGRPGEGSARSAQPYTAADVHFMSAMIAHHAQAIVMAGMARTHDAGPSVRVLAERIASAQQDEIRAMQEWLRAHGQPVPSAAAMDVNHMLHGVAHALIPGMLSESQMQQLDASSGKQFDRLFLSLMIQHHQGAISMVDELFASYGAAQDQTVFKLASDVDADQSAEIARMQTMLLDLVEQDP